MEGGKVIAVSDYLEGVKEEASKKLGFQVVELFNSDGGAIDDAALIRDSDVLYATCTGESFTKPRTWAVSRPVVARCYPEERHCGQDHLSQSCAQMEWVHLNVGGRVFATTVSTLTRTDSHSMLARMFTQGDVEWQSAVDENGAYLIDRSPRYFEPILNFLRHGQLVIDKSLSVEGVLEEAKFFGVTSLIEQLEDMIEREQPPDDSTPVTRRELAMALMVTPTTKELRCQVGQDCFREGWE
jgi:hypothetical protein